ncbi:MAG: hypothetical protein HOP02_13485 [Methylococcaceae bacterium]|nr:hypothetical protein [Methylococcaceae bacterium]
MSYPAYLKQPSDAGHEALRQFIYTPIEEAINLLDSRQQQAHLKLLDFYVPEPLNPYSHWEYRQHPQTAVMFRQIATPNHEMRRVVKLCEKHQLNLLILSFQEDKFISHNSCKHALGRMGFFEGLGRHGGKKIRYSTIINFNQYNGRLMRECQTLRGQPLMKFHHDLLFQEFKQLSANNVVECSDWFIQQRAQTGNLYRAFLKLFLKHAILIETFVLSDSELDFTLTRVLPAFQEIVNAFGIKPLIVNADTEQLEDDDYHLYAANNLPPPEDDDYWLFYPGHLHALAPEDRRIIIR